MEFSNIETTKSFLKTVTIDNAEIPVEGSSVKIKAAKTQIQKKRNYALIRASELITELQKSTPGTKKTIQIEWKVVDTKDRHVTVDGVVGFCQNQNDSNGTFKAPFLDLSFE